MAKYYIVTQTETCTGSIKNAFCEEYKNDWDMLLDMNSQEKKRIVIFYSKIQG